MADELVHHRFPRLEDLCIKFVSANGNCWNPEAFLEIPRHLLFSILKKFHPFDVERLEVSGIFQTMGLDTDPLWKGFYHETWPRKSRWPDVYFKKKGISKGSEGWQVCYLQRCLQDALNCRRVLSKVTSCSPSEGRQNLQDIVSVCGRYATYLRLYNKAFMLLVENMDLCLQLAEYIEFLEVFLLRDNGVNPLCNLLQLLTSRRLKSVGFCFCKVSSVQLWGKITDSLSTKSHQYQADKEEDNLATSTPTTNFKTLREKSIFFVEDTCNQLNCEQEKTASKGTSGAQADLILDDYSNINEGTCDPLQETDDVDIYAFNEWNDAPKTGESALTMFSSTCKSITSERQFDTNDISWNVPQSVDLYDEVFGHSKSGQPSEVPTELSPHNEKWVDKSSELSRFSPGTSKLESPLPSLPNLSSSLVHFELVAFWPHPDLFAFFVQTLKAWLALETIILEDNGLGLASTPGQEFVDTLAFLCTKGKLQSLQITNNAVNDEFAKLLFERLVVALCHKCSKSCDSFKSLTKLKFSSHQVSPRTSVYLGKAITDVCTCKLNNHSMVKMLGSVFSTSDSATDIRDLPHACCSKQKSSYVSDCMISESSKSSCKTNYSTVEYDNTQKLHLGCKINAEQTSHFHNADLHIHAKEPVNSSENFSQGKKPLLSIDGISNVFVGIQVLQMSCMVGNTGASFIAKGLRRNSTLRCLSLAGCDINTAGLAQIFQALSDNRYLKHVCVKGNHYDLSSDDNLAEMLSTNNTLTELDISDCHLRGLSKNMIDALCVNQTLITLKLAKNGLGDNDISALSEVFSHPSKLSKIAKLDLSFNHILPESLSILVSSLKSIKPRKLDELKLTQSLLGPGFHQVLPSLQSVVKNVIADYLDRATLFADFISQM